jgi:hypothetical protein
VYCIHMETLGDEVEILSHLHATTLSQCGQSIELLELRFRCWAELIESYTSCSVTLLQRWLIGNTR